MSIHKAYFLLLSSFLYFGCAASNAPSNWLPETEQVPGDAFGGWLAIITYPDTIVSEKWMQYGGEFIASDSENVYLLYDTVYVIPKITILKAALELDKKNTSSYTFWTFGGTLSTITNGAFAIITAPFWLVTGIPATIDESNRDTYSSENPDSSYWKSIQKFARFPQGLPANVNLKNLKPKKREGI
ncbi:MAG TPA: hypothetical protein VFD91_17140 [Mariniphaga sp.]|nr:hypothetical protein [Mariniphaga sp.]